MIHNQMFLIQYHLYVFKFLHLVNLMQKPALLNLNKVVPMSILKQIAFSYSYFNTPYTLFFFPNDNGKSD